jgi:hypothetical protein
MNDAVLKVMEDMKETFIQRGKVYGDNYLRIGPVMNALFPDSMEIKDADDFNRLHLFMMILVKLTRLACCNLKHKDSIHDIAVYAAMWEAYEDNNS